MTSNHHAPYDLGYKRDTMAGTKRSDRVTWSETHKNSLSSDWSLQLDSMKSESLVIANQHVAVNTFSGFVHTARQTTKVGNTQRRWPNPKGREPSKVGSMIGVNRHPYGNVGMDPPF